LQLVPRDFIVIVALPVDLIVVAACDAQSLLMQRIPFQCHKNAELYHLYLVQLKREEEEAVFTLNL
jgi:hypothetical protein